MRNLIVLTTAEHNTGPKATGYDGKLTDEGVEQLRKKVLPVVKGMSDLVVLRGSGIRHQDTALTVGIENFAQKNNILGNDQAIASLVAYGDLERYQEFIDEIQRILKSTDRQAIIITDPIYLLLLHWWQMSANRQKMIGGLGDFISSVIYAHNNFGGLPDLRPGKLIELEIDLEK